MTGLVPVIHVVEQQHRLTLAGTGAASMAGTSPAMTEKVVSYTQKHSLRSTASTDEGP